MNLFRMVPTVGVEPTLVRVLSALTLPLVYVGVVEYQRVALCTTCIRNKPPTSGSLLDVLSLVSRLFPDCGHSANVGTDVACTGKLWQPTSRYGWSRTNFVLLMRQTLRPLSRSDGTIQIFRTTEQVTGHMAPREGNAPSLLGLESKAETSRCEI